MSPEARRLLEKDWPLLAPRLRALLLRKGVGPTHVDDIVQETALRLVQMGDDVDRTRSPWPLAVTIALNLLRDEYRSAVRCEIQYEVPDAAANHDVESAGIARAELTSVIRAMRHLTQAQRAVLMGEIEGRGAGPSTAADKMMRMRARKKLRSVIERLSAAVAFRSRRISDLFGGALSADGAITKLGTCLACAFVGLAATMSFPVFPELAARPTAPGAAVSMPSSHFATGSAHLVGTHAFAWPKGVGASTSRATLKKSSGSASPSDNVSTLPSGPSLPVDKPAIPDAPNTPDAPSVPVPSAPQPDVPSLPKVPVPSLPLPSTPDLGPVTSR